MMKTILVTGASRGIGRATALLAGARGWSVGVNYVANRTAAEEVVAAVEGRGGQAVAIQGDVSAEADVLAMFDVVERSLGPLDGLVVNAGTVAPSSPLADMGVERMRRMFEVNVLGAYLCAREGARRLSTGRGGRGGAIVLMGSTAAVKPLPTIGHYAAAKSGLVGLAKSLALELAADGVRVNVVHPGGTGTYMTENPAAEHWQATAPGVGGSLELPMGIHRMAPGDVAGAVRWLCTDEARYVTGVELVVDAGATLR